MIRTLTLDDCLHVVRRMRPEDRACVAAALGTVSDEVFAVSRFQTDGPAWTLEQDGEPVAIFGLSRVGWIVTAWFVATPAMQSWRKAVRHCRTVVRNLKALPVRRVEAHVLEGWSEAERLVRHLGFRHEGTRRAAGSAGENIQMWAIVKD